MLVSNEHPEKENDSIDITDSGIIMSVSNEHSKKAYDPMKGIYDDDICEYCIKKSWSSYKDPWKRITWLKSDVQSFRSISFSNEKTSSILSSTSNFGYDANC